MLSGLIFCLVGFAINIADVSIGAKYFGTFLVVAGAYAGFPGVVAWCVTNCDRLCMAMTSALTSRVRVLKLQ